MGTRLNGSSLFTGIYSGLTNTYSILAQNNPNGVTLDSINSARSNNSMANSLNQSFASYIQTNFANLDKNSDGILAATEMTDMTNAISTSGLTQSQLVQLGAASGLSTSTLEQVLEHFSEIDSNGDGKVTTAEITAYSVTSERDKKKTEYAHKAATNISTFYGSDSSSDTSSILDHRYLSEK